MRSLRLLSTFALLTVYGAVGLLGHGLHMFDPHGGHHHVARVSCVEHSHEHHGHTDGHSHEHGPACHAESLALEAAFLKNLSASCDEDCAVCQFLAQARSAAPDLITRFVWHQVSTEVVDIAPQFTSEIAQGLHVPRGPPVLAA